MQPEIEQFQNWLTSQYPSSSTRIHYTSDLVLFFSWANLPPASTNALVVDEFIQQNLRCQDNTHQLRHTAATLLLNAGMSTWSLRSFMRHQNVDTTLRYARTYDEKVAEEYQMVAANIRNITYPQVYKNQGMASMKLMRLLGSSFFALRFFSWDIAEWRVWSINMP